MNKTNNTDKPNDRVIYRSSFIFSSLSPEPFSIGSFSVMTADENPRQFTVAQHISQKARLFSYCGKTEVSDLNKIISNSMNPTMLLTFRYGLRNVNKHGIDRIHD